MLLSLFSGAGGMDLGFEQSGYKIGLAFEIREQSVKSYNHNRAATNTDVAFRQDIRELTISDIDTLFGSEFAPSGIIGGPPCQSFSRANKTQTKDDPRHELPKIYADLIIALNERNPVPFFVFENVTGLLEADHIDKFNALKHQLDTAGFEINHIVINATSCGVPQARERLIMVGLNRKIYGGLAWVPPTALDVPSEQLTVGYALRGLPEPVYFSRDSSVRSDYHVNHWCMRPKSTKFTRPGALVPGNWTSRSFKTLSWDKPSITVAYGNREVHVHPNCKRRLSVLEAMRLQGFPHEYELCGTLSDQITQVSEAVPPPMAYAIAKSIQHLPTALTAKSIKEKQAQEEADIALQ